MTNMEKLANLFAERTNPFHINIATGEVVSVSPLKVQFGDNIILDQSHLVVADHVLNGYQRTFELSDVQITQLDSSSGDISMYLNTQPPPAQNDYVITNLSVPQATSSKITATMTYTDSLKEGDQVILVPDNDFKKWYVLDKVGVLNG